MSSLLPIRSEPQTGGQDPRIVDLEGEDAEKVFSALSSSTAREIVTHLHEQPSAQSDIAEELDTTVQNVRYHLDKLEDAGLVEVVDTWYSSRGNEMKVYAPADGALIVSGDEGTASRLRSALSRLVGGVAVLAMASVLLQTLLDRFSATGGQPQYAERGDGGAVPAAGGGEGVDDGLAGGDGGDGGDGGGADGAADPTTTEEEFNMGGDGGDGGDAARTTTAETDARDYTETVTDAATQTRTAADGETATATVTAESTPTETPAPTPSPTGTPEPTATPTTTQTTTETATTDGGLETVTEVAENATRTLTTAADGGGIDPSSASEAAGGLPPGLAFFLGGASVLVVLTVVWYLAGR